MFEHTGTTVVVGAQWGDEGKGKLVDVLSEKADWVVRYQGGANAGHTVHIGEKSFVLHQIPSGILQGVRCALGNGVVLDPQTLFGEMDELEQDGVRIEQLLISEKAHLVLPYHKVLDSRPASVAIGTTGRGIGPAYEDKTARRGIRVMDLRHPLKMHERLKAAITHHAPALGATEEIFHETLNLLSQLSLRLLPLAGDVGLEISRAQAKGQKVLLEGAQGSMLDLDHGTYPFVTSSNTTAGGAAVGVGISPLSVTKCLGVVKAYTTRVGHGPLPTELDEPMQSGLRELGAEWGATTGRARRCGWFDAVVVQYAVRVNGLTDLAVTKLDVLDTLDEVMLCTGYRIDGEIWKTFPGDLERLERAIPIYERFAGWKSATGGARRLEDLPREARAYLDRIEGLCNTPISFVSVGTQREQIIQVGLT